MADQSRADPPSEGLKSATQPRRHLPRRRCRPQFNDTNNNPEGPSNTTQPRRSLPHRHCRPQFNESVAADAAALAAREEVFWQLVRRILCQVEDGYTTEAMAASAVHEAARTYQVAFPEDEERFAREDGAQTVQVRHLQRAMQARDEKECENPPR